MLRSALIKLSLSSLLCSLLFGAAYADVYKYKDEKGNVLYTDKPMFLPAERMSIKTDTTNAADAGEDKTETTSSQSPQTSSTDKKKTTPPPSKATDACGKAQEDYLMRMNSRLYEEQANGEKRYLSDKELEAARVSAKKAMDAICK